MWLNVVLFLVAVFVALYWYLTRNFGFFLKHGVFEAPSSFPFGSGPAFKLFTGRASFSTFLDELYTDYSNHKMVGHYSLGRPGLVLNDLDLIKQVLIKDFDHFTDRRTFDMDETEYLNKIALSMLVNLKGDRWKMARSKISPAFTSGKLKQMMPLIHKVGDDLNEHLKELAERNEEFSAKSAMTNFTLDAIASCGFGVEANSFKDPNGIFPTMAMKLSGSGGKNVMFILKVLLAIALPKIAKTLKIFLGDKEVLMFFTDVVKKTVARRKATGEKRNDFVDTIQEALSQNASKTDAENNQFEKDAEVQTDGKLVLSDEELELYLIANLMLLFLAGFDTSSSTMSVMCVLLAKNPEVQECLHAEIKEAVEENGSTNLDYNTIQNLPYLDQTIHETLRYHPLTILERKCTKDYKMPGTNLVIPKDMLVQIPAAALMRDPKLFPFPNQFNPENFSSENRADRSPYSFLGFGQGPRNCVGMRFALLQVKVAMVQVIANYKLVPGPRTPEKLVHEPMSQAALPKGGTWVKVEQRGKLNLQK